MALYGATTIKFAKIKEEPTDALPTYDTAVQIGALQKFNEQPNFATGKQSGDNRTVEQVDEFVDATLGVDVTELAETIAAQLFGGTTATGSPGSGDTTYAAGDNAPYGGLTAIRCKQVAGVRTYSGVYYPKVKATRQSYEFATVEAGSVSLNGRTLQFTAFACNTGAWNIVSKDFDTQTAAETWAAEKLGGS